MSVEEVVTAAKQRGVGRLALTDINNSSGEIDFVRECRRQEVDPVAGMEFRNGDELLFVAVARNNEGFREINEYRSKYNFSKEPVPENAPDFRDVYVIYPFGKAEKFALRDNERVGIAPWEIYKLYSSPFRDDLSKVVVLLPVAFETKAGFELHRNLRAVAKNTLITKLQSGQTAHEEAFFWHPDRLRKVFEGYPQVVYNTEKLLADCQIDFDFKTLKNKKTFTSSRHDDKLLLEKLARDGFRYRYHDNPTAKRRMEEELKVIDKLGFAAYFLITWDIIRYSMSRGFYHVGRGSGANSIVAYCLRITDVDPVELNLYFERFINPRRSSPPDFDIDYSWTDRD
jgi:DNA polymerase-3 subunit alpha